MQASVLFGLALGLVGGAHGAVELTEATEVDLATELPTVDDATNSTLTEMVPSNTWDCLSELHPNINGVRVLAMSESAFDGVACNESESRCFVVTESEVLSVLLPGGVPREPGNKLLISWDYLKLLPPAWYSIVVEMPGSNLVGRPTRYMAVPEDRLKLDGYPGSGEIGSLRLVLYPNAWRFFMMGLHEPMRAEGAWPTATQVMQRGFTLPEKTRDELAALLDVGCPPGEFEGWCPAFREALLSRHWPSPCVNVVPLVAESSTVQEVVVAGAAGAAVTEPLTCAQLQNDAFVDSAEFPTHEANQMGLRKLLDRIAKDLASQPTQVAAQYWRQIVTAAGWECSCARQKETRTSPTRQQSGLQGWRRAIDPATGRPYYYNMATGKSQWQRPTISPQQTVPQTPRPPQAEAEPEPTSAPVADTTAETAADATQEEAAAEQGEAEAIEADQIDYSED